MIMVREMIARKATITRFDDDNRHDQTLRACQSGLRQHMFLVCSGLVMFASEPSVQAGFRIASNSLCIKEKE